MTPVQMEVILHYYYNDSSFVSRRASHSEAKRHLLSVGLLQEPMDANSYRITDRGRVYVESLIKVPLPTKVERWLTIYPESKEHE